MPAQGDDHGDGEKAARYEAEVARLHKDAREQRRLFEAREGELVARYPKQTIAMCAGEVFVGKTPHEAAMKAKEAHPGRASFLHLYGIGCPAIWR